MSKGLRKSITPHNCSVLLNDEENKEIFNLLSREQTSLATAIIQLLITVEAKPYEWQLYSVGVMCFVKNRTKRSYFFQLYDFDKKQMIWAQEIYLKLNYIQIESTFHMFEADKCMVGLNFADETEAIIFGNVVNKKINLINKMHINIYKYGYDSSTNKLNNVKDNQFLKTPNSVIKSRSLDSLQTESTKYKIFTKSKKSKYKLNKLDIGMPTDFKHIQHIGWNPSTGFDFNIIDPKLESFFNNAGISKDLLKDADTRKFIYNFINTHGGIEAAILEANQPFKIETGNKQLNNVYTKSCLNEETLALPQLPPPLPPPLPLLPQSPTIISTRKSQNSLYTQECKANDSRDELLSQIRKGINLKRPETKSCEQINTLNNKDSYISSDTLADALSKALHNRFRVNQLEENAFSENSDSNSDFGDNEWNN